MPGILDQVQVLDEQVAVARAVPEQGADLVERFRIDLPPLRPVAALAPAGASFGQPVLDPQAGDPGKLPGI